MSTSFFFVTIGYWFDVSAFEVVFRDEPGMSVTRVAFPDGQLIGTLAGAEHATVNNLAAVWVVHS